VFVVVPLVAVQLLHTVDSVKFVIMLLSLC